MNLSDKVAGTQLYTSCMPVCCCNNTMRNFLDVDCMDASMLTDVAEMMQEADLDHFICKIDDVTQKCVL